MIRSRGIQMTNDDRFLLSYYTNIMNQQLRDIDAMYDELKVTRNIIDYITGVNARDNIEPVINTNTNNTHTNNTNTNNRNRNRNRNNNRNTTEIPRQRDYSYRMDFLIPLYQDGLDFQDVLVVPSQSDINRNTRQVIFSNIEEPLNNSCPIQLGAFEDDQQVTQIIGCGHIFNTDGIDEWFQQNVHCPVCRYDIRDEINNSTTSNTTANNTATSNTSRRERDLFTDASLNSFASTLFDNIFNRSTERRHIYYTTYDASYNNIRH